MARKLEKRSARILAIILAFIMLGSVFAYVSGGGTREKRETKVNFAMLEAIGYLPENSIVYYYNLTELNALAKKLGKNDALVKHVENLAVQELSYAYGSYLDRRIVEFTHNIEELIIARYGDFDVYFVNENASKVYFAKQTEQKIGNITVKFHGGVAIAEEVHPLVIGYAPLVLSVAEKIEQGKASDYSVYLSHMKKDFVVALVIFGNATGSYVRFTQNESPVDFFFQGFRFNESSGNYEKVLGMHFTENYFFYGLNETEKDFEYYYFENFEDRFSVAVMGDKNFTKVLEARPNVMGIIIKEVETLE
ncbi:MAG: hypothetical protein ACK401_00110 [Archaeoglobaceae archaeon]